MISRPVPGFQPPACAVDRLMTATTASTCWVGRLAVPASRRRADRVQFRRKGFRVSAAASGGDEAEPKMDYWDRMELKFGRLMGEDPKLTLAKIMERKSNPEISYLDVEKSFSKGKGKTNDKVANFPSNGTEKVETSSLNTSLGPMKSIPGDGKLNLSRPVLKGGSNPKANGGPIVVEIKSSKSPHDMDDKSDVSNVTLRKPSIVVVDDIDMEKSSELKIQPNLYLKMRKGNKEPVDNASDVTLLKKPQPLNISLDPNQEDLPSDVISFSRSSKLEDGLNVGEQSAESYDVVPPETEVSLSVRASLQGKPQRLDQPKTETYRHDGAETGNSNDDSHNDAVEIKDFRSTTLDEREINDWIRAEDLFQTGDRGEVELISCSNRGFVASFGSLLGFLPYRNLGARWKFLAFESWLRKKGLDPSLYKQNLGIMENVEVQRKVALPNLRLFLETEKVVEKEKEASNGKLEDLLQAYDQEKARFLSSFIGQRLKVSVVLVDRNSRKLMFSGRPREKEEIIMKKRSLMAKLSIGDVVKCRIKKITYFGIFVEVEGVPALIHQSEVSWDASLDPSSYYKIGQIVQAKVHQLDFGLERITLSLKEIMPDPLVEALESVVGDHSSLGGNLQTAQANTEWPDVEALIKELHKIEGIKSVSKGRFFISPGLAPTFQVYMGSMFENQYKLLARSGNKVQEVIVQASLDKEQMKAVILTCTNRVE